MTLSGLANRVVLAWGWKRRGLAFGAGAISALAMAPFDLWPVLAITFPVFVWLLDGVGAGRRGLRAAFATGWWFGFGYFLAGLYWTGFAFLVEADKFAWLLPFAVVGLPIGLAIFTGLGAVLARVMWTPGAGRVLAFALGIGIAEWLRGNILSGFPWNNFGYALTSVPAFAQGASLIGLWGLMLVTLAVFASPAVLADSRERSARPWLPVIVAGLVLFSLSAFGWHRLSNTQVANVSGVKLRLMQPNLPQNDKFRPDAKPEVMKRYLTLSDRATAPDRQGVRDVTHLIWPESAFPFLLEREADALAQIADLLPPGISLVTGAIRAEAPRAGETRARVYNSIRVLKDDGAIIGTYDKVYLVPFGEFVPLQDFFENIGIWQLLERAGLRQLTQRRFDAGTRRRTLNIPGLPLAAPLICYEAIYPGYALPEGPRPRWLLNLTNDAWFGISPGPYQHFAQARLRAIEEGLPLVRVANNGISAVVDPLGRIIRMLPLGGEGLIDSPLPQAIENTFYARHRNGPALILAAMFGIGALISRRRRKGNK